MNRPALLPVDEARAAILASLTPTAIETRTPYNAHNAYLAAPIVAGLDHPAAAVSAMDGFAYGASDSADLVSNGLTLIGESAAGTPFDTPLKTGQAVRIFTGALLPDGADTILIQEDAKIDKNRLLAAHSGADTLPAAGRYVRRRAQDFAAGDLLISPGTKLTMRHLALAALAGITDLPCHRAPVIAVATTGDELVPPGQPPLPGQLVNSNSLLLSHFIRAAGAIPVDLGILPDQPGALHDALTAAGPLDLIVTTGGASVGDHDHIVSDLTDDPASHLNFWKIAMRPGKPLIWANWRGVPLLGLPGNPVSTAVCALQFLGPAIDRLMGGPGRGGDIFTARLTTDLPENDKRQDYLRARLETPSTDTPHVTPASRQDSAMMHKLAQADCLIIRPPFAKAAKAGDSVQCQALPPGF